MGVGNRTIVSAWQFFESSLGEMRHSLQCSCRVIESGYRQFYMKWNFRMIDVARSFLKSSPLGWTKAAQPPYSSDSKEAAMWVLAKPIYGLIASCKDWYVAIRDFLSIERGRNADSSDKSVSSG